MPTAGPSAPVATTVMVCQPGGHSAGWMVAANPAPPAPAPQPVTQLRPTEPVLCPHPENAVHVDGTSSTPASHQAQPSTQNGATSFALPSEPGGLAPHCAAPGGDRRPMAIVAVLGQPIGTYVDLAFGGRLGARGVPDGRADHSERPAAQPWVSRWRSQPGLPVPSWKSARRGTHGRRPPRAPARFAAGPTTSPAEDELVVPEHRDPPKGPSTCSASGAVLGSAWRCQDRTFGFVPSSTRHGFRWPSLPPSLARAGRPASADPVARGHLPGARAGVRRLPAHLRGRVLNAGAGHQGHKLDG